MVDTVRGAGRIRAWPRTRSIPKGSTQAERNERFRVGMQFIKYLTAKEQATVNEAVKGTPLMPRDILTQLIYRRVFQLGPGGPGTVYSMATRQDVSESLDALANTPGQTLVRGTKFWEGGAPASGGGGFQWNCPAEVQGTPQNSDDFAFKGTYHDCVANIVLTGIAAEWLMVDGAEYKMIVAEIDGSNVIQTLQSSDPLTGFYDGVVAGFFDISATLTAGLRYAIMVGRTDSTDTYRIRVRWQNTRHFFLPLIAVKSCLLAEADPEVGDTITDGGGVDQFPVGLKASV